MAHKYSLRCTLYTLVFLGICVVQAVADKQEDLAKESQNPIGNIISLPFENNFDFGVGPEDAFVYKLNVKPVYPLNLGNVNLINRFILPVIYQEERVEGEGSEFGLGDFTYQAFRPPSPARSSGAWGRRSFFPRTPTTGWEWISGRRDLRSWPWPNLDTGWLAYWFKMCGPMPVTTMHRM